MISIFKLFFFRDLELVELHASKDGGCDMRITANSTGSTGDDVSNSFLTASHGSQPKYRISVNSGLP